jgi:hypothetical protein
MITKKAIKRSQLEAILSRITQTPEGADLEFFLEDDPDVEMPFTGLFMAVYEHHVHTVRLAKIKRERAAARAAAAVTPAATPTLADLGLDPQPTAKPPPGYSRPAPRLRTDAHTHPDLIRFQELYRILRRDNNCPRYKELCQMIMELGPEWDYDRGPRWPADEDKLFIEDLATNEDISEDSILLSPKQGSRVRAIGSDFQKWLYDKYATAMRKTNGGF